MAGNVVRCQYCWRGYRVLAVASEAPRCGDCEQPLPWVARADGQSFTEAITMVSVPVVVDLRASWAGPCRLASPVLDRIARERAGLLKLLRVDVDEAPRLSRLLSVETLPTLVVMRDGEVLARRAGAASAAAFRRWVREALSVAVPAPEREPALR